ncbi:MAG: hypothetical protein JWO34_1277 [Arthrobacter sp.]|jgi:hypothetical protein|nr:hypothetical protein [Arthrobacter sp.]
MTPDLPGARHKPERIHSAGQTSTEPGRSNGSNLPVL